MDNESAESSTTDQVDHLQHVRLRAPKRDGRTLDLPPKNAVDRLLKNNIATRQSCQRPIAKGGDPFPLDELRPLARAESIQLAVAWSNQYLRGEDRFDTERISPDAPIIFGGHQPTLFHPGVWYKNFRLQQIARNFGASAINMVVDNDLCGTTSINFPQTINNHATIGTVAFDATGPAIPFEMRHVVDRKLFEQFQEKVVKSIKPFVPDPIVKDLWPEVLEADEMLTRSQRRTVLAHSIAAGRHRVEHSVGLKTLEVPISHLAGSFSFAKFSRYLLEHLGGFREIYNAAISRYRAKHGIRSSAHPVPELGHLQEGGNPWLEAPFWIWTDQTPFRKPLFVRRVAGNIELSNSQTTLARIALAEWDDWLVKQNQQIQTTGRGIFIRPRALITTMYARMLASDLFVHGIGGAKYDQLTDQIIQDFFGVAPPRFVTATGTWALPTEFPKISPADITTGKETLRRMRFHPETFITSADKNTAALIAAKHAAIANQSQQTASQRHQAIESANLKLQAMLHLQRKAVSTEIDLLSSQLRDSQILNSREFSFALHPIELIERLIK